MIARLRELGYAVSKLLAIIGAYITATMKELNFYTGKHIEVSLVGLTFQHAVGGHSCGCVGGRVVASVGRLSVH
jgi:hypothetical protein